MEQKTYKVGLIFWYTRLSSEFIYNVLSILRKEVFDKSIFDRMEGDHCDLASDADTSHDSLDRALDMTELIVHGDTQSLEDSRR